jgi:hypothetical protein
MMITSHAMSAGEMRDEIVADLRRREKILRDSVALQKTKATKACCYVCAEALKVAAADYEGIMFI